MSLSSENCSITNAKCQGESSSNPYPRLLARPCVLQIAETDWAGLISKCGHVLGGLSTRVCANRTQHSSRRTGSHCTARKPCSCHGPQVCAIADTDEVSYRPSRFYLGSRGRGIVFVHSSRFRATAIITPSDAPEAAVLREAYHCVPLNIEHTRPGYAGSGARTSRT